MKNTMRIIAVCLLFPVFFGSTVLATDFETVVLTDKTHRSELPVEVQETLARDELRQQELAQREVSRKKLLTTLRRIVDDTESHGFAVVDDAVVSDYDDFLTQVRRAKPAEPIRYGYTVANLDTPAFDGSRRIATESLHEDEGVTYQTLYAFEFDDLGTVLIDELSYTTIPDARIVVNKPAGNLHINGYPATYTAMMNRDGTRGMTTITFYTENKLISVTALRCITRDHSEAFEHLVQVTSSLY